ncbi:uncharacterized protein KGF55_004290 [Candida pseudojiufengensis]|uniref:uncharacterized protein n=1 Tax=Candida pseudojiufengensis TaxID=497109 RepID=UPI0022244FC4|nr:uncharacterized protein KGF55_004290 [Candida pseudojiufengensis]KAI5961023.1 hypothetical protein KGF55_004290 [Candida pseudojiufengensis]
MGNPNNTSTDSILQDHKTSTQSNINSISFIRSIKDWWSCPTQLMYDSNKTTQSKKYEEAKLKNRIIEYELFRAILPDEIYIKHPINEESASESDTTEKKEHKIIGELLDDELDDGTFIHEFFISNNEKSDKEVHIVIIHGYMAALGYFIKNIEPLAKIPGIKLHLIDLPGFGNSSRPKFPTQFLKTPTTKKEQILQILEIENWFIDKIENWRIKRNINKFKLIAHSMGAYLSCCYLMKYNIQQDNSKLVDQIILVSPMGTESNPISLINDSKYDINLNFKSNALNELKFEDEINNDQIIINEEFTKIWEKLGQPKFPKNLILKYIWENNYSPFQILQKTGPLYSKLLSYWSFQRFKNFEENSNNSNDFDSKKDDKIELILKLHNYSYSIFNQFQISGELAITKFINHEILAKLPLCDRGLVDFFVNNNINNYWIYGDKDWMNYKGGEYIFEKIQSKSKKSDRSVVSKFEILPNSGHHIYLDNPKLFNERILEFFDL